MGKVKINGVNCFVLFFSEHYSMSNILPKDSFKVSYTLKITVSKQFDNFAKRALRVTETGTLRILSFFPFFLSFLSYWHDHILIITPGSANLEF